MNDHDNSGMDRVFRIMAISLILGVFGLLFLAIAPADAQAEERCDLPFHTIRTDMTPLVMEAYVTYDKDITRWDEIANKMREILGGYGRYVGTYDVNGSWVLVVEVPNGYLVYIGDDWTVGDDNQWHSPKCMMLVHTSLNLLLHYPTNYPPVAYGTAYRGQ